MKRKPLVFLSFALLMLIGMVAIHYYKTVTVHRAFRSVAVRDNALLSRILTVDTDSPRMSFTEYLQQLERNREERDNLISEVAVIEPFKYADQLYRYTQLLQLENEFVRAEEKKIRHLLKFSVQKQAFLEAEGEGKKAVERSVRGEANPFSPSSIERGMAERNETQVGPAAKQVIVFEYTEKSAKALSTTAKELLASILDSQSALEAVMADSKSKYPTFLPDRGLDKEFTTKKEGNSVLQLAIETDRSKYRLDDPYWDK